MNIHGVRFKFTYSYVGNISLCNNGVNMTNSIVIIDRDFIILAFLGTALFVDFNR